MYICDTCIFNYIHDLVVQMKCEDCRKGNIMNDHQVDQVVVLGGTDGACPPGTVEAISAEATKKQEAKDVGQVAEVQPAQ